MYFRFSREPETFARMKKLFRYQKLDCIFVSIFVQLKYERYVISCYQLMLSTVSHIPPTGDWKAALGSKAIGVVVFGQGENRYSRSSFTSAIFVCMMPKREPMQILGPSPVRSKVLVNL